jgi:hypothetical protein
LFDVNKCFGEGNPPYLLNDKLDHDIFKEKRQHIILEFFDNKKHEKGKSIVEMNAFRILK